ncbi:ATP-binding cassette domain-containing protein [Streptomyces sp. NPDC021093]|uniref:ATP-binding cassette domain-containing protein n=1 Tax=Streptomyces sp. NPDC021093 TaxID=3365112 RepID=UPI0037AA35C0
MAGNLEYPDPVGRQPTAVALDDVSTAPGEGSAFGLRNVTLGVWPGRFLAVMGPPGSGSSALLGCIAGQTSPVSGNVRWGDGGPRDVGQVAAVGTLPPQLRVSEVVERRRGPGADAATLRRIYRGAGLRRFRRRRIADLPAAVRQRVAVAAEAAAGPSILLAGLPDRSADGSLAAGLRGVVDSLGLTAVMATDDPAAAARADSVVFMRCGAVVDMAAGADAKLIEGCLARIRRHP